MHRSSRGYKSCSLMHMKICVTVSQHQQDKLRFLCLNNAWGGSSPRTFPGFDGLVVILSLDTCDRNQIESCQWFKQCLVGALTGAQHWEARAMKLDLSTQCLYSFTLWAIAWHDNATIYQVKKGKLFWLWYCDLNCQNKVHTLLQRNWHHVIIFASLSQVMHNCRLPSDMLWHQYGVSLVNIFDTQVRGNGS